MVKRDSEVQGSNPGFKGVLLLSLFVIIYLASMERFLQDHVRQLKTTSEYLSYILENINTMVYLNGDFTRIDFSKLIYRLTMYTI